MEKVKLSIIIPVYNVEKYLLECVNSFDIPPEAGYEIILIDDGSTDSSGVLCEKIKRDLGNGVTVIHQRNRGLSAARNSGLEVAKGTYIAFVDSDDRIAKKSLEKILSWIEVSKADICIMRAEKFYPDGRREDMGENIHFANVHNQSSFAVIEHIASRPKFPGSVCTKIFRREFLEKNHFRFPKDKRHSDDLGFVSDCLITAHTFDMLDIPYYEYRQNRQNSITNSISSKTFWDMSLFVEESVNKLMLDHICINSISELAMSFAAYEFAILLWRYCWLNGADRREAMKWLQNYRFVLSYGKSKITKEIYLLSKCVGLRITALFLDVYKTKSVRDVVAHFLR